MKSIAPTSGKYAYNERYFFMQISAFHKQNMRQILVQNARASVAVAIAVAVAVADGLFRCTARHEYWKLNSCTYSISGIQNAQPRHWGHKNGVCGGCSIRWVGQLKCIYHNIIIFYCGKYNLRVIATIFTEHFSHSPFWSAKPVPGGSKSANSGSLYQLESCAIDAAPTTSAYA